jgi:NAD(P)-dependent dehydrogenase (short-subunit alcohol dehydrogenase family)
MVKTSGFKDKMALVVGGASGMVNAVVRLLSREECRTHVFDVKAAAEGLFHRMISRITGRFNPAFRTSSSRKVESICYSSPPACSCLPTLSISIEEFERVLSD